MLIDVNQQSAIENQQSTNLHLPHLEPERPSILRSRDDLNGSPRVVDRDRDSMHSAEGRNVGLAESGLGDPPVRRDEHEVVDETAIDRDANASGFVEDFEGVSEWNRDGTRSTSGKDLYFGAGHPVIGDTVR